jgi:hypothetical protein
MRKIKTSTKEFEKTESKPAQLAKIIYAGLVRMINTKNAAIRAQKPVFELDFDRKRRVNTGSNVDQ